MTNATTPAERLRQERADRLRQARAARGMSQSGLAKGLKLSRGAVGQWETCVTSPTTDNLRDAAILLNVDFDWLATGRGRGPADGVPAAARPQEFEHNRAPYSSDSAEEAWVFPSSFIQEATRSPATRLVTVEVPGAGGPGDRSTVEITIVGRLAPAGRQ